MGCVYLRTCCVKSLVVIIAPVLRGLAIPSHCMYTRTDVLQSVGIVVIKSLRVLSRPRRPTNYHAL